MISMEERVNYLDRVMAELAHAQMRTEIAMKDLARTDEELRQSTLSMQRNFEEQGKRFEEQGKRFAEQGKRLEVLGEHMDSHAEEMKRDTAQMKRDTAEMKRSMDVETRKMKKAWGDLANKMGTVAEDVVAPNIPRLATEEFGMTEVEDMQARARRTSRRGEKRWTEYDIVCAGPGKVIVVEVKSTPTLEKIQQAPQRLDEFFDFFPEYVGRDLIGVFASWSIDAKLLPAISAAGLYGIAMGEEAMDVVARPL